MVVELIALSSVCKLTGPRRQKRVYGPSAVLGTSTVGGFLGLFICCVLQPTSNK
jgi:hypothetical protein